MPSRLVVCLMLALLAVPLTGCLDRDDGAQEVRPTGQDDMAQPGAPSSTGQGPTASQALRYADIEANRSILWRNGSFTTEESCLGGGCITYVVTGNQTTTHPVDLASLAPPGVPAKVHANLTYPTTAGVPTAAMTLGLATPATLYGHQESSGIGEAGLEATLVRASSQPLLLNVSAGLAEPDGTDYTLRVSVTTFPDRIMAGVPTAVELGSSSGPAVASVVGDDRAWIMVWDSDDTFLAGYNLTADEPVELPNATGADAPVVLVGPRGRAVHLTGADGHLRALGMSTVFGEATDVTGPPGEVTWTFEVTRAPLAAGVYLGGDAPAAAETGWSATVRSPEGQVVEASRQGVLISGGGSPSVHLGGLGGQMFTPGTYEGTFEHDGIAGRSVGGAWLTYER